ncbi:hypothetical protein MTR_1g040225 [Medicago truncatula]|uniref:Uncharacterized protein n=1 Tax=Medicago truncatula TaxID=3880 RepID=A0A072VGQ9_MEDTR|nr:hypothetical protein MTR_1g040225 [Medicago truncatula]
MESLGWEAEGRAWEWRRRLLAWEEESVRECSEVLYNIVLQDDVPDTWRWLLDHAHGYSLRDSYRFLTSSGDQVDMSFVDDVWHRHIPVKVSLFPWRSCVIGFQQKIIYCDRILFMLTTWSV